MFAGYGFGGERMWVHSSSGSGVVLNSPSYESSLVLRRPAGVDYNAPVSGSGLTGNTVPSTGTPYVMEIEVTHYCPCAQCKHLGEGYIRLIKDVGSREALTRRFFLIFQYEELHRTDSDDFAKIYSALQTAEQTARAYFMQCGNSIL